MPGTEAAPETAAPAGDAAADTSPAAGTNLTGGSAAPEGGEQPASSEAGQGTPSADGEGQGAGNDEAPNGGASAEGEAPAGEESQAGAQGAPEQYEAFSLPDGYALEGDMLDSVTAFAKAQNLTQEQAQALVDLGAKQAQAIMGQITEQATANPVMLAEHWAGVWSKQTAEDPEVGGDKLAETVGLGRRVLATFGTPEFAEFLTQTGLAHNLHLVRFMHKVGKAVSEDTLVTPQGGNNNQPPGRDPAKKLYPGMA